MHTIMQDAKVVFRSFAVAMTLVIMAVVFYGCAAFNNMVKNDALISQLAVEAATARVLHDQPTWKNQAVTITSAAISAIDSKAVVQLADVESFVRAHISWSKLLPEEQAILSILITQTVENLTDSFRAEKVIDPGTQLIEIKQVLIWIRDAAKRQ